ncbi:hypothetical protein PS1_028886 [Malus domestica]
MAAFGYSGDLITLPVGFLASLPSSTSLVIFSFPFSAHAILIIFIGASEKGTAGLSTTTSSGWLVLSLFPSGGTKSVSFLEPVEAFSNLCNICSNVVCKSSGIFDIYLLIKWIPPGVPKLCSRQEFSSGTFPGRRTHSSLGGWRRLRAVVGLLLHCRALSGKARRAKLIGQDSSGKACRARLEEKDNVNFERCFVGP